MTSPAICDSCGKSGTLYSCMLCGRRVCGDCLTVRGVCKDCISGRKVSDD
ncbi:MAG: orotate phosphoribosyltransferase [Methanobacteriota archaeon]